MRTNLLLPRDLVERVDRLAGRPGRSRYVAEILDRPLRREAQGEALRSAAGMLKGRPWLRALVQAGAGGGMGQRRPVRRLRSVGAMTGGHLLDTSFVIDYWHGRVEAVARIEELYAAGAPLFVNDVFLCELFAGLQPAELDDARRFLEPLEFLQPGPEAAATAGRWHAAAGAIGRTLHLADPLIAAAAGAAGAAVLTRKRARFRPLTGVRRELLI